LEIKQTQTKKEYSGLQGYVLVELFKKIVKNIIPLELRYLEKKILKLEEVTNFDSLDSFFFWKK